MRITALLFCAILGANALDFSPASVQGSTFGAFSIGYTNMQIASTKTSSVLGNYDNRRNAVYFALKRGMLLGENRNIILSFHLDGHAGSEYKNGLFGFSFGGLAGYRLFNGRVIALLGGGYGLNNLATHLDGQYNIHGFNARAELFIDIAKGYGVSLAYQRGFSLKSKKLPGDYFTSNAIMVSFSFYDFSI